MGERQACAFLIAWQKGSASNDDAVDWATSELASGVESEALLKLACLYKPTEPEDHVPELLREAFDELGYEWRERRVVPTVCDCLAVADSLLHTEEQDTESDAWKRLLELVDHAAADGWEEFIPGRHFEWNDWSEIITLPASISRLKSVKRLCLYGSNLVRIPPEIGDMTALEMFDPYTSYRLHWFPYEIMRCRNLKSSRVSTRALYGNFKYRPPFPRLPSISRGITPGGCSVCGGALKDTQPHQVWISLLVATDVLPVLVHACSEMCVNSLPKPPAGYIPYPHRGGSDLRQPPSYY
jgi:hypothetical protein